MLPIDTVKESRSNYHDVVVTKELIFIINIGTSKDSDTVSHSILFQDVLKSILSNK